MNKRELTNAVEELNEDSSPARGLAQLLVEELVLAECGMDTRLTQTELVFIATSLKRHCSSLDTWAARLQEMVEDDEQ